MNDRFEIRSVWSTSRKKSLIISDFFFSYFTTTLTLSRL